MEKPNLKFPQILPLSWNIKDSEFGSSQIILNLTEFIEKNNNIYGIKWNNETHCEIYSYSYFFDVVDAIILLYKLDQT